MLTQSVPELNTMFVLFVGWNNFMKARIIAGVVGAFAPVDVATIPPLRPAKGAGLRSGLHQKLGLEVEDADVGEVAIAFVVVEAVADHEFVGNDEAEVIGANVGDAAFDLVEKDSNAEMFGLALFEETKEIFEGEPGVENIFDDEDGTAFDADVEIFVEFHFAGGIGALAVAGDGDEVEGNFATEFASEIGEEKDGTFEDADEMERFLGEIIADLFGHFFDAVANVGVMEKDANRFVGTQAGFLFDGARFVSGGQGELLEIYLDNYINRFGVGGETWRGRGGELWDRQSKGGRG
jgi:hypothetical protein